MAVNKNAYLRYQVLDRCFRNTGRNYTIENLLEEINNALLDFDPKSSGIKRRQLFDDIKYMESEAGFSIELDKIRQGKGKYYRYADPKFSIKNVPISESEAEYMKSAIQVLSRFSGIPQFSWVDEIIPMLETKFGTVKNKSEIISFESNIDYEGSKYIQPLFNAILNRQVLVIQYKTFKQTEIQNITFHPYYLKQYNNRWFVFGLNEENKIPTWNLALDRIRKIQESDNKYVDDITDWEDYFYDIIGVSRPFDGKPEEVTLHFDEEAMPYVQTKPLHPSQKSKVIEGGLEVRIKVIPNFELVKTILSYGKQVKVIEPISLVNKIRNEIDFQFS